MNYTVRWNQQSLDALADIWLVNAKQRTEINEAAANIDHLLANDPVGRANLVRTIGGF